MNVSRRVLAPLLCVASLALNAQKAPQLGETIDVSIVNVEVVVTDREGNRVRGLTREDFEILESGKPQPISNFSEYASTANERVGVTAGTAAEAPMREKRNLLIFFERMQLAPQFSAPMFEGLKETISRLVEPGDAVSVVMWSRDKIEQTGFTDDVPTIHAAIDRIAEETAKAAISVVEQQRSEAAALRQFIRDVDANAATLGRPASIGKGGGGTAASPQRRALTENVEASGGANVDLYMLRAFGDMKVRVAAINSAITSMSGLEGKKIMLVATHRLGEVAGAEYAYSGGAKNISSYMRDRYGTADLMKSLIDNANGSGVTIYPVNAPGIESGSSDVSSGGIPDEAASTTTVRAAEYLTALNETVSLRHIAAQTGGLMAAGPSQIVDLLPRIASDATDYYSLAYRVRSDGRDRARNIVVRTRRPGLNVRARTQFVEKSDDSRMRDRLRSTLFRAQQDSPIAIAASAGQPKKNGKQLSVPVQIKIPIGALTILPQGNGKHAGSFSVYVGAAADLDELSDLTQKTQPFQVGESELAQARAGHFTYELDVTLKPKTKYVAVGVFDEVGRTWGVARLEVAGDAR